MTESATLPGGPGRSPLRAWQAPDDARLAVTLPGTTLSETPPHDATLPGSSLPDAMLTDAILTGRTPDRPRPRASDSPAPRHCGTPMEWRSPEPAAMSSYSFGPADRSMTLPAVWRCRCGFQLDGIEQRGVEQPGVEQGAAGPVAHYPHSR
ncbi:hypothetical protein C8D78_1719 [Arthrobacter oryzae]|uniref:Uncharacterized protein n=2 Tax=Arthrobacter oryzae TaxID=409290 RepID=A0A495ESE5_9MICC|nr:hypothetical protein C8D78_1719 [Arthrobacter oryzae]